MGEGLGCFEPVQGGFSVEALGPGLGKEQLLGHLLGQGLVLAVVLDEPLLARVHMSVLNDIPHALGRATLLPVQEALLRQVYREDRAAVVRVELGLAGPLLRE